MVHNSTFALRRPRFRRLIFYVVILILVLFSINLKLSQKLKASTNLPIQPQPLTGNLYPPGFNYPNGKLCPDNGKNIKLIILIASPPSSTHQENRKTIRETWHHFAFTSSGARRGIVIGFMMGIGNTEKDEKVKSTIKQEIKEFDDIIIGNYVDSHDNLTLKTLSMLEWAVTYCSQAKHLLKTDDDMWINVPGILKYTNFLDSEMNKDLKIYGSLQTNLQPHREVTSKYFVSRDYYPQDFYPDFVSGKAYILPQATWEPLYLEGLRTKYIKLEDTFFTGIVAEKLAIQRINVPVFIMDLSKDWTWTNKELNTKFAISFTASLENIKYLTSIWNAYTSVGCYGSEKCKIKLFADTLVENAYDAYMFEKEKEESENNSDNDNRVSTVLFYVGVVIIAVIMLLVFFS